MNFEAVPCMLRTGADGSSVYGLLIRPSAGVVQQQQLQPQSAVIVQQQPSTSGQQQQQPARALQLVPSGAIQQQQQPIAPAPSSSSASNKILLPNVSSCSAPMHVQLAPAPLTPKFSSAPQVAVVHSLAGYGGPTSATAPAYSAPTVFDSPSPSQVVPQMSMSDGYEHAPITSSVVSTAQPTPQHVYMQPLMEQYDYAQQPLPSSSTASYAKPTTSSSIDVSGLELLDDLAPMDIARLLAESESVLSPDCPMLEGAVVDSHSLNSYNPVHQQHAEQQASCSTSHQSYSAQPHHQHHQQIDQSSSRTPLNIEISCQQQQQQELFAVAGANAPMPACRYVPQPQLHQQHPQQQQQFRPAPGRRHAVAAPMAQGMRTALRPQLDWEQGPNDSSGTPDSGIQSIAGSPPSNGVYTPPLMSPSLRNGGQHARRSSGPSQISPSARTSSLTGPGASLGGARHRPVLDGSECAVDERPTSSSSSAATTTKERPDKPPAKRVRKRKKRKGEFADMPRLFPAFRTDVDSSLHQQHDEQDDDEQIDDDEQLSNVPIPVNVGDKLSQMEAKFDKVCSRLDSALDKRSTDISSPTIVSTELGSPAATNTSPSTASGPPSTSISLDCEDPTALAERLLSLKPDLIEQVASIIQSKTKCKEEQSAAGVSSSSSAKEKPRKSRRASSSVHSPSTDAKSHEKRKLMLDRLRQYRQKARIVIDTRLLEHIIDLSAQLRSVHISDDQSPFSKSPKKFNWFSVNLERAAERLARRKRLVSPEIGLENEADSADDDDTTTSSADLVSISEHPRRISLKIKRGALISAEESTAAAAAAAVVASKKRPNAETQDADAELRRAKKRRKKPPNPWDRKPAKKQKESSSSLLDREGDGLKSVRSLRPAAAATKDMTGTSADTSCKVVLRRLSDERQTNDSFCVVSSVDSQGSNSSSTRKASLKSDQSKSSPTKYESEVCKVLRFDDAALQKCCKVFGRDFRLPNNWIERRLPASSAVRKSSKDYRKIRSNIYVDQPPRDEDKQQACSCSAGSICGEDCLNRMMFVECTPGWCPCEEACTNRRFQRHQSCPSVEQFETIDGRGSGVRASARIDAGTFMFEYVGEVVSTERFADRMSTLYREDRHHYGLDLCAGFIIDSYRAGNIARFVNHSCEPNCQMQKWNVNGQYRVGLFALRDLRPGEELTYDYKFAAFEDDQLCSCASAKCRGTISAARSKSSAESSPSKGWQPRTLSHRERGYVAKHRIFLLRCFDRNYKKRFGPKASDLNQQTPVKRPDIGKLIRTHIAALDTTCRTVQTRRLSVALEDECFLALARLAQVLNQIYSAVTNVKDDCGQLIVQQGKKTKSAELSEIREMILTGLFETPEKFDIAMKAALEKVQKSLADAKKSNALMVAFSNAKRDCAEQLRDVLGYDLSASFLEQTPPTTPKRQKKEATRAGDLIPTETDLSYMDGGCPVGSYDPDDATDVWAPTANDGPDPAADNVRCICGMFEEDGLMVQCDRCLYWLHSDCVHPPQGDDDYICEFCACKQANTPTVDILLNPQPAVKLKGCVYYRTLVSSNGVQVRLNESVYVKRLIDDQHKAILKKLHQQCVEKSEPLEEREVDEGPPVLTPACEEEPTKSELVARERPSLFVEHQRKDLRVFRVERLFKGPNGQRFVFGCYYARPHETFCEPTRMFCKNELFWTPLFDTLPLDAVVGRCLVLEPSIWCKGRPRLPKYREDDIFICEYRVDKSQRFFEKIAQKNRYYINTERYIFDHYEERLRIKRNFTPFIMPGGTGEHPVKVVAESDDEDLVPLGVIRFNLQRRKRAQMMQRLENIVQSINQQTTRDDI